MVPGAFFGSEYTDRHITQNLPVNSTVISVSVQRLPNATYMAGLACDTDRHSSMIRMLKKSASLSCSFGLSGLFGLSRAFGFSGSGNKTNQMDQTDQMTR
jgi:hypothetical protein